MTTVPGSAGADRVGGSPTRRPGGRHRLVVALSGVLLVLVGLGVWGSVARLSVYSIAPGVAEAVTGPGGMVHVPSDRGTPVRGRVYMTDVELGPVSPIEWVIDHFRPHVTLRSARRVVGSVPSGEVEGVELGQMAQSVRVAEVAALRALGYRIPTRTGPEIVEVLDGTPGARLLARGRIGLGWVIVGIDGHPVESASEVSRLVAARRPGTEVLLRLDPGEGRPDRVVSVRLAARPRHPAEGEIGIGVADESYWDLPFPISIDTLGIGGPSAGLAFALGIVDELGGGELTGGRVVAATGTIGPDGQVGAVAGVAEKAVAVRRVGASIFFVPPANLAAAERGAAGRLTVVPVSSLGEALRYLAAHGGTVPARPARGTGG